MKERKNVLPPNIFRPPEEKNIRCFEKIIDHYAEHFRLVIEKHNQENPENESQD